MKKAYSINFYEEGLRNGGAFEFETAEELWDLIKRYSTNKNKITIRISEHEIELPCDMCSAGSVKDYVDLTYRERK